MADFIGLDTCLAIMDVLHEGFGDSKYRPCPLLKQYVAAGWLGKKIRSRFLRLQRECKRGRRRRSSGRAVIEATRQPGFALTDDQRAIGEVAREVAAREIAPHIAKWDREHVFPRALYGKLAAAGLMGMLIPEAHGGVAADYVAYALAIEELAKVDAGTAVTVSVHSMICNAIAKLGSSEQQDRWLERLAGDTLAGFALTEPDAGSDAAAIRATARRDGDRWLLNGRKQWCTNGGYSGVVMAMFRSGGPGSKGISAFLVDSTLPGIVVEKTTEKLGIHTSNTVDLAFDDVAVPAAAMLGEEGAGLTQALTALDLRPDRDRCAGRRHPCRVS